MRNGEEVGFFVDETHTVKDRGVHTGRVAHGALGEYVADIVLVRGRLVSVPSWRFVVTASRVDAWKASFPGAIA